LKMGRDFGPAISVEIDILSSRIRAGLGAFAALCFTRAPHIPAVDKGRDADDSFTRGRPLLLVRPGRNMSSIAGARASWSAPARSSCRSGKRMAACPPSTRFCHPGPRRQVRDGARLQAGRRGDRRALPGGGVRLRPVAAAGSSPGSPQHRRPRCAVAGSSLDYRPDVPPGAAGYAADCLVAGGQAQADPALSRAFAAGARSSWPERRWTVANHGRGRPAQALRIEQSLSGRQNAGGRGPGPLPAALAEPAAAP
jgi:hypothetical protein